MIHGKKKKKNTNLDCDVNIQLIMKLKEDHPKKKIITLGSSLISWKFIIQKNKALSPTKAEYTSLA